MLIDIENPFEDGHCFFCGPNNASGLKLRFQHDEETGEVSVEYTPEAKFQGQGNVFHGGMQMGILDEAMWWAGYAVTGIKEAVTASASFRFLRPVYIGEKIRIVCKVKAHEGRSIRLQGWILNPAGKKCTTVKGEYREMDREMYEKILSGR